MSNGMDPLGASTPRARNGDPETSHEAAASLEPEDLTTTKHKILQRLETYGNLTDVELVDMVKASPSGVRTRRHELVEAGLVEFAGEFAKPNGNRRHRTWTLTGAGQRMAERIRRGA